MADMTVDGILIGGGHNALVCAGRLARRGLEVLVVEQAPALGGGCSRAEDNRVPGLHHQVHSVFHRGITAMPWYRELQLERHGVRYLEPEANIAFHLSDGRALVMHTTGERTAESIGRLNPDDARAWESLGHQWQPVVEQVINPLLESPPEPAATRRERLEQTAEGRTFLGLAGLRPVDAVLGHFRHPAVRALLCAIMVLREIDITVPGQGFQLAALVAGRRRAQLCLGGARELAEGLGRALLSLGGLAWTAARPRRILLEGGRAVGIELEDGRSVAARRCLISGIDPGQTFLELLGDACPPGLAESARAYRYSTVGPLFGVHLALRRPPRYRAAEYDPAVQRAFMHIFGADGPEAYTGLYPACAQGRIPAPICLNGSVPTLFDASLRGKGGEQAAFVWQKVPYALGGDARNWDRMAANHARTVVDRWNCYADGVQGDNVLNSFTNTPLDTERRIPNMVGGDLNVGHLSPDQAWDSRPFPLAGDYRTPIPGLYLCGAGTHPYGNVTGLCGHNAATVVARDLALPALPE
ncbi:MAG: NAD(P)/FAD-dependent oxidoreductase [Candidatus Dormibacteraeota bacterium]|uniref:NAD(P)/FAD-dependent oxidoreductase n=2 Tax=Candidatus Dormiibacter inghamiae TaxID=3127013 RepID=A0A934KB75_9BACT|nr:NAD(P)/FAD-dependent oxidoreductase [Candidatus Dormibacteraeota bacterium]MBJ7606481.1 NAD(P)/FAD-dependent oxidoreductase [Candidatus Dormibacteraeota bacterium]